MEEDEIQIVKVTQRKPGGCCIHQTTVTTLIQSYPEDDHQELQALIAAALRETDASDDYSSAAAQVGAIEAVVAHVKNLVDDAVMVGEKNRVQKLERELAELKRELERYRQERRARTLVGVVAGAFLPDSIAGRLRGVRDLLNLVLGD